MRAAGRYATSQDLQLVTALALPQLHHDTLCCWLLRQHPIHQALQLRLREVHLRPHVEALAPVPPAACLDHAGQLNPGLGVEAVTLRDRAKRRADVVVPDRVALEAALLAGEAIAAIVIVVLGSESGDGAGEQQDAGHAHHDQAFLAEAIRKQAV